MDSILSLYKCVTCAPNKLFQADFRNTPITVEGSRDANNVTPSNLDGSYLSSSQTVNRSEVVAAKSHQQMAKLAKDEDLEDPKAVEEMTPTEEENLLSSKLVERR